VSDQEPGGETIELANTLTNLGMTCARLGRYSEAETAHQRALSIFQRLFGSDQLDTVTTLNNLGAVYLAQGQYQKVCIARSGSGERRSPGLDSDWWTEVIAIVSEVFHQ
jgi:tetratricopeptide (TPR) repeat protein